MKEVLLTECTSKIRAMALKLSDARGLLETTN